MYVNTSSSYVTGHSYIRVVKFTVNFITLMFSVLPLSGQCCAVFACAYSLPNFSAIKCFHKLLKSIQCILHHFHNEPGFSAIGLSYFHTNASGLPSKTKLNQAKHFELSKFLTTNHVLDHLNEIHVVNT